MSFFSKYFRDLALDGRRSQSWLELCQLELERVRFCKQELKELCILREPEKDFFEFELVNFL